VTEKQWLLDHSESFGSHPGDEADEITTRETPQMPNTVLSTGVILRDSDDFNANVTVVNLDPKKGRTVTVELFDWGVEQV
jgi:hypothetical protein